MMERAIKTREAIDEYAKSDKSIRSSMLLEKEWAFMKEVAAFLRPFSEMSH